MSTPLTDEQYSELVRTLELMRSIYANDYAFQPQQMVRDMWTSKLMSAWCMVYLTQWFGKLKPDSAYIPLMVAELCEERMNAARL